MEYRKLGRSGLRVSELALGTMQFGWTADRETSFAVLDAYAEAGGNLGDTADVYSRWAEVRYVGCSNYPAWRLMDALWASDRIGAVRYASLQPHYNLVHRAEFERELAEVVEAYGLGVLPYSPLAGGFLTGKYRHSEPLPASARAERIQERYFSDRNFAFLDRMDEIARAHGRDILQVALAWLLANPRVTAPIVGANSVEQLRGSLAAIGFRLDEEEMAGLDKLSAWQDT